MASESCASKRKARELWSALRQVQRRTDCTYATVKATFEAIKKLAYIIGEEGVEHAAEKQMWEESGSCGMRLDGCAGKLNNIPCTHVFLPSEKKLRCPKCTHPRFNVKHEPNQVSKTNFFLCACIFQSIYHISNFNIANTLCTVVLLVFSTRRATTLPAKNTGSKACVIVGIPAQESSRDCD